ncbi:hypothetical protein J437_LFUL011843 [Ladona fulva]|uniref:Helitron helicase-like domain-containing protein n=1 Tax=Ladona fulva TaxID=123851 RepID=A0A8K0NXB8_LADFU|nr:hypothetical protein J437_LFUL011843 [Ladona fulva]
MLGGEGKVVEIDESKFGKRKFNRGRLVEGKWVFGGIERGTEGGPKIGKVYLPSSFTHSPRYVKIKMQDGMALVSRKGRPSFFITITCNPQWVEIQESPDNGQTALDRPDLCNRVFQIKLAAIMRLILSGKLFGKVIYVMYVIEFQKRGLPHAHIALKVQGEPKTTADIDSFIRATIPSTEEADG